MCDMEGVPGGSGEVTVTKKKIFEILKGNFQADLNTQIVILEEHFAQNKKDFKIHETNTDELKKMLCNMKSRWKASHSNLHPFYSKNEKWLESSVTLKNIRTRSRSSSSDSIRMGRPVTVEFETASERTKKRRTEEIRSPFSTPELIYATQKRLSTSGSVAAANILKDITTSTSPTRTNEYREAIKTAETPRVTEMSPDEALLDIVNLKLTKQQYLDLRSSLREKQFFAYPSYVNVSKAKKNCYPVGIEVTETSAEVKLQSLLDHTCQRILKVQQDVINTLHPQSTSDLRCIIKWGCDSSSGHSQYKQKFSDEQSSDTNIFLTSLVPLQIIGIDNETNREIVVWKNPRPSSTRFCRPIKLQFLHENVESTRNEKRDITSQIDTLVPYKTITDGKEVIVKYEMHFTMIDGKVANAVSETKSAMRCHLCKATSKEFNDVEKLKKREIDPSGLQYGLSSLHAWIRCFECLLHIGYKVGIHKWQAPGDTDEDIMKQRKCTIQKAFKSELHLNIDCPKPGFGSSNDGNTARRFFENSSVSARILGVDETLINKFHIILQVFSSGFAINVELFQNFCLETAEMFVHLYSWYCMPTSVHKILIHGARIVDWAPLPIGQLSEDAQEARNKYIKKYRENFSRKCSKEKTMEDVFQRMMITSDPYISSLGKQLKKARKSFSPEATAMFLCSDGSVDVVEDDDECE